MMFSYSRHKSLLLRAAGSTLCCRFCRVVELTQNNNVGGGVLGEGIVRPRMMLVPPSTWHMHALRSSFAFSSSSSNDHRGDGRDASETKEKKKKTIRVVFVEKTGEEIAVEATVGESVMEAAHQNDVELEGTCNESFVRRVVVSSFAFETTTFDNNSTYITHTFVFFFSLSQRRQQQYMQHRRVRRVSRVLDVSRRRRGPGGVR